MAPHYFPLVYEGDGDGEPSVAQSLCFRNLVGNEAESLLRADPSVNKRCNMCNNKGTMVCGKCGEARYCSSGCQKGDWPSHKIFCNALAHFKHSERPSPDHFRALIFPVTHREPEFIWLKYDYEGKTMAVDHPDLDRYAESVGHTTLPLPDGFCLPITDSPFFYNKEQSHGLVIMGLNPWKVSQTPEWLNQCQVGLGKGGFLQPVFGPFIHVAATRDPEVPKIQEVVTARDQDKSPDDGNHKLPGTILANTTNVVRPDSKEVTQDTADGNIIDDERLESPEGDNGGQSDTTEVEVERGNGKIANVNYLYNSDHNPIRVQDITMRDLRNFVDYYLNQVRNPCIVDTERTIWDTISAIKISNVDDEINIKMGITKETATLPVSIPMQSSKKQYPVIMAHLVGLSWWVRLGDTFKDDEAEPRFNNPHARHLKVVASETMRGGRTVPCASKLRFGRSLLLIHAKGLLLDVHHLNALNGYLDLVLLTKGAFSQKGCQAFWEKYKADQERAGVCMDTVLSPYELEDMPVLEAVASSDEVARLSHLIRNNPATMLDAVLSLLGHKKEK